MRVFCFIFLFCFSLSLIQAQKSGQERLIVTGFSYPDFGNGTTYKNFTLTYSLEKDFEAELRWFYDHNGFEERLRIPLLLKKYISNKTYILGGGQAEFDLIKKGLPRIDFIIGAGHEINESFILEATLQTPVNKTSVLPLGSQKLNTSFLSLGSKFKF